MPTRVHYRTRNDFLLAEMLRGTARVKTRLFAIYRAAVLGREAARTSDASSWRALASGLADGRQGLFGKRPDRAAGRIANLQLRLFSMCLPLLAWGLAGRDLVRRSRLRAGPP